MGILEKILVKVEECHKREKFAEIEMKKKQTEVSHEKEKLEKATNIYQYHLEREQNKWMNETIDHFSSISETIKNYIVSIAQKLNINISTSVDLNTFLNFPIAIAQQCLVTTTALFIDETQINHIKQVIFEKLNDVKIHCMSLSETDPMYLFISFYCDIMRISFSSLSNSARSWKDYSQFLQTSQMKFYAEQKKKESLCQLNLWTREQCSLFLNKLRMGFDQNDIMQHAQNISKYVRKEVVRFDVLMTDRQNAQFQQLIREFERFVSYLLITGCRYFQLQRGIREPIDDVLITGNTSTDVYDFSRFPNTEVELLTLLERYENQLNSRSDILLFFPLHLTFKFNSNPFNVFDQIERSIQVLIKFILPASFLIERTWTTIDKLIENISQAITTNEYNIINAVCDEFSHLASESSEIDDKGYFISDQLRLDLFERISYYIDELCKTILKNRSNMKPYCEDLNQRWHLAMKEIFRGFIKTQKFHIHRQISWNQRNVKLSNSSLLSTDTPSPLRLANIENIVQHKALVLQSIDTNKKLELLTRLQYIKILYELTVGGIDNLELVTMSMPMEHMDYNVLLKLVNSTRDIYDRSEKILLEESLIDYIHSNQKITTNFELLENIYKQEFNIFNNFYAAAKALVETNFNSIWNSINLNILAEKAAHAKGVWFQAGADFVNLRQAQRTQEEAFIKKAVKTLASWGHSLKSFFVAKPTVTVVNSLDNCFAYVLQNILTVMQREQDGISEIFTIASQEKLNKLIHLHEKYQSTMNLLPLNEQLFPKCQNIFILRIDLAQFHLPQILVLFWNSDKNKAPCLTLSIPLNYPTTQVHNVVKTKITYLSVCTDYCSGNRMKWYTFADQQVPYYVKNILKLTCIPIYENFCFTVKGTRSELNLSNNSLFNDLQNDLTELEIQLTKKEHAELLSSTFTQAIDKLSINMTEITTIICSVQLNPTDLLSPKDIYNIFTRLPNFNILKKVLDLLEVHEFTSISPAIQVVTNDDPAINIDFQYVQTNSMYQAFRLSRQCLIDAKTQMNNFINNLHLIRAYLTLTYAWANARSIDLSPSSQEEFGVMLKECTQLAQRSLIHVNEEILWQRNECQRVINDARQVYKTIKRTSNNWTEIKRLTSLSLSSIEDDFTMAFAQSEMSRDVHLWLIKTKKDDSDASTIITCDPRKAIFDFGFALISIHRRLTQRIYIHNHTNKDLDVRVDRELTSNTLFDVIGESQQVNAGHMCELEVNLRPASTIGSFEENWNLLIDNNIKISNVIQPKIQIVEIDVEIPNDTIDFGLVPCSSHRIEKMVSLKNVLSCPVRIKSQIQATEASKRQSQLILMNNELELPENSVQPFSIALEPAENIDEDINADVCLAIDSAKNLKWIKILAQVRCARLSVIYQDHTYMQNGLSDRVAINNFYKQEIRLIPIEFRNDGQIDYTLRLSSSKLLLTVTEINLPINITKEVPIEIHMSDAPQQEFVLIIDFVNMKRQCKLVFDCQTAQPRLSYVMGKTDTKKIITIAQSAHMHQIWNQDLQTVLPIEHEIMFSNTGKAAATINYKRIVSSQDTRTLVSANFHVEPNNVIVPSNSKVPVRLLYYPVDFEKFDVKLEFQTNTSVHPIHIPYYVEFHTPILKTTQRSLIDIGLIETGKVFKKNVLTIENIGKVELRFAISEPLKKKSFVKVAALQESSEDNKPSSIKQPLKVEPKKSRSFNFAIEFDTYNATSMPEMIGLVEFELLSLCDPVIDIERKLVNRTVTVAIVGHTVPVPDFALPQELKPSPWSDLSLLPSSWLHQICQEDLIINKFYNSLIALTAIAHVCGLPQTNGTLPLTPNEWSAFCINLNNAGNQSNKDSLALDLFQNETTINAAINILIKLIRSSLKAYRPFFHQSSLFHRSFSENESIRLQLFSVINVTGSINEAYNMQSYVLKLWNIYEQCTSNDGCRQAIDFVHQCISNDCAMPESIRTFTKFIHQAMQSSETGFVAQQLSALMPSTNIIEEFTKSSTKVSDFKTILLFLQIDDGMKELMIRLVKSEWQSLLDLFLIFLKRQQSTNPIQQTLLLAAKNMDIFWNALDSTVKSDLLASIFTDYIQLIPILQQVSYTQHATLKDLLTVTEVIFSFVQLTEPFTSIRNIFKETHQTDISLAVKNFLNSSYSPHNHLESKIYTFRKSLTGDPRNPMIHTGNYETFCDIMYQLVALTANQWIHIKKALSFAYVLLCDMSQNHVTLSTVLAQIFLLLDALNPNKKWYLIRKTYINLESARTWDNARKFIEVLDCDHTMYSLTELLRYTNNEQDMIETIFELCNLIFTKEELDIFKQKESTISKLSFNNSTIEAFKEVQPHCPPAIREKIYAYLVLIRLSSDLTSDIEIQHILFDNIVPSWLALFDINCTKTKQLFQVISSMLTSFLGLINTRGIPLAQQLYTTSLTSTLCRLSNFRQRHCEFDTIQTLNKSTINVASIITVIHETIDERLSNHPISPLITIPQPVAGSPSVGKPVLTAMVSVECPYSEWTLTEMETSVLKYIKSVSHSSPTFYESDTVQNIVDVSLNTRKCFSQWYATFTTFNVLVHYPLSFDNPTQMEAGHEIVQYGLRLYRDLIIARKILGRTFSHTGVQFLMKELTQLEKCLLSLSLEKYPIMRNTLRQLNIDVSRIKVDFNPPSKSIAPKSGTSNKFKFDMFPQLTTITKPTQNAYASHPITMTNDDAPISYQEWESTSGINDNQQMQDTLKLAKHKKDMKFKSKSKHSPNADLRDNVFKLASDMLDRNTNPAKAMPANIGSDENETFSNDAGDSQAIKINLGMIAMQQHLQKQPNLIEMYEKINNKVASVVPDGKLDNRSALKLTSQHERWTYQLIVEIPAINHLINLIVKEFRASWDKLDLADEHQIHWCIMIDNSGSMSVHQNAIYEALVVILELLRKLESKFAVARFGTRTNQKILKNLDDLFTNQDGQYILEALTFDEGTYPATGLARVADRVFPANESEQSSKSIVHRLVLMITDGLTQERDDKSYSETLRTNKINLGFMFIETADQSSSQVLLKGLKQAQSCVLKANNIYELPYKIPQLMHDMVKACLGKLTSSSFSSSSITPSSMIHIKTPIANQDIPIEEIFATKQICSAVNQTSYTISNPAASIPKLTQIRSKLVTYLSQTNDYTDYASHAIESLRQYYHTIKLTSMMQEMERRWISKEFEFSGLVDDLSTVLGDIVFPFNKFTRRRAALRGSSLYLPGVIKAITTEWNYKKIFSAKLAGGKRDHAICLVLDVSTSMFGTLSIGMIKTIVVFIAALRKLNLENFSILVFDRDVRLIKTDEQSWDAACIYTLVQELRFNKDDDTKDAHALEAAIDLLSQCSTRGERKIFILTDGYSNCGNHLSMVQQRAEDHGIDIIAMAIGTDQTNLESVYKRYLQCATPYGLPKALRALFEQETQLFSLEWPPTTNVEGNISEDPTGITTKLSLFDDIKSNKVFGEIIQALADERKTILINSGHPPSNITVDICFCLDCTGSMSRWLSAAKEQMKIIIEGITKLIEKEYPSLKLKLRFAIVGYRDIGDNPPCFVQDFTDNTADVISFLKGLNAGGGGDIPEDVLGALNICLDLSWSHTNARFIVLITDAPGHGPELNSDLTIDGHPQGVSTHTVQSICNRLLKKDAEIDLMFCCIKPKATAKLEQAFSQYYNAQKDETGKQFTTIKLFDDKEPEAQSFHFVMVLDESGSMKNEWNSLVAAYNAFLDKRNADQGTGDYFTVIQFGSNARLICQRQPLAKTPRVLSMIGSDTNYCLGLQKANETLAADNTTSSIVMIFMSDGADGSGKDPVPIVQQLKQQYGMNHNFVCHTVGFGSGVAPGSSSAHLLQKMASAGGGQTYSAKTGHDLQTVFTHIAANSTTSDALVKRFAAILAQEISVKIMVDYL